MDYFEKKAIHRIYLADSYRATAILTLQNDVPYLDKFAVTQEAQGAGVGGSIWRLMEKDNPKLFWRSRAENAINTWYFEHAQGSYKSAKWTVFWYGLEGFAEIRACVAVLSAISVLVSPSSKLSPANLRRRRVSREVDRSSAK